MTQKERAIGVIEDYLPNLGTIEAIADLLEEVVGQAQNGPPEGEADGSIIEEEWYALCDILTGLRSIQTGLEKFCI